jgi:hypothetical protein
LARRGGYRAPELRAATSLSRLLAQRGDPEEARRILGDIYSIIRVKMKGRRPLVAHCHLGLGKLYRPTGKREQAREHPTTATTTYREMGYVSGECDVVTVPSLLSAGARRAVSPKFVGFGLDRNAVVSTSLTSPGLVSRCA